MVHDSVVKAQLPRGLHAAAMTPCSQHKDKAYKLLPMAQTTMQPQKGAACHTQKKSDAKSLGKGTSTAVGIRRSSGERPRQAARSSDCRSALSRFSCTSTGRCGSTCFSKSNSAAAFPLEALAARNRTSMVSGEIFSYSKKADGCQT